MVDGEMTGLRADLPCRFAERGCASPAVEVVHAPAGCICWTDPVQALCEQHLLTMESAGPVTLILDLRQRR